MTCPILFKSRSVKTAVFAISLSILLLLLSYAVFNIYIRSTAKELISGWAQTEAISLQEGNVLGAVSKSQRLIFASDFVRGVSLITSNGRSMAQFGDPFPLALLRKAQEHHGVVQHGVFSFVGIHQVSGYNDFRVLFWIEPRYAPWVFGGYAFSLAGVSILFLLFTQRFERGEAMRRERVIQTAINDLVAGNPPSQLLIETTPNLIHRWSDVMSKLEYAKAREAELVSQARLGDLARQVAHDIRSPLSALTMITASVSGLTDEQGTMIRSATQRIAQIANSMLTKGREVEGEKPLHQISSDIEASSHACGVLSAHPLSPIVAAIVAEKKIELQSLPELQIAFRANNEACAICDPIELGRVISNLINNAVEALGPKGCIDIALRVYKTVVTVTVAENGKGIPEEILPKLATKGATFDKDNGNGLGLYHAKQCAESWGGRLQIQSRIGVGTMIEVQLPRAQS